MKVIIITKSGNKYELDCGDSSKQNVLAVIGNTKPDHFVRDDSVKLGILKREIEAVRFKEE
jgi:hypothetical protein